jgi:replicative DNA helicase
VLEADASTAELAVLGAVIATGGSAVDDLALTGDDFADARHGELFDTMRAMHSSGEHVDQLTLSERFPGQSAFIWQLTDHAPFASAATTYAEIVAAHGMHRRMKAIAAGLLQLSPQMSAQGMVEFAQRMVDEAGGQQKSKLRFVADILPDVIERMKSSDLFVPSPWPSLNKVIGGLRPGAVYVVGARPGVGKTVVAAQIAAELSKHGGVAFASLEMSQTELVGRLISERLGIFVGKVKDGTMTDRDWATIHARRAEVENLKIAVDDRASVSPADIRQFARAVKREAGLSGVVVDYLQLMSSAAKQDRHVVVSEFSRQMKIMAKDLQVPVILLSQLNRQSEQRADAAPKLSELRESGAIEQDADVVILLSRRGEPRSEELVMDVAKNRHGTTDVVSLAWQGELSRAVEWGS